MKLITQNGEQSIEINEIDCYRGISHGEYNCVIYLKSGEVAYVLEDFETIDKIFDL